MAFTKLKLTTFGTTLETKWKQGKGVHFTRIALGDGLLGNGSMINRTSLISERHSIQIDGITAADDAKQAVVIGTLDNGSLEEGFPYRELALMAKDPDTGQEGTYLYDNAGQECEFLDTQENGTLIYERIKILIRSEQTDTITFEASGNPVYLTAGDLAELIKNKADLDENGKVVAAQLPNMNYAPNEHAAQHAAGGRDPITPGDIGALPTTGTAAAATKLATARTIRTDLASAATANFDGSANVTPGVTGTLPLANGGTAGTTAAAALYNLINGATALTAANLATGDVLGLGDVSAATGKKVTLANLITYLQNNLGAARIATGSYVGTGTYGSSNPCSLTFDFSPKILFICLEDKDGNARYYNYDLFLYPINYGEAYQAWSSSEYYDVRVTWGENSIAWYVYQSPQLSVSAASMVAIQKNTTGKTYHYIAIG